NSQAFKDFCDAYGIAYSGGATSESHGHIEVRNRDLQKILLRRGLDSRNMSRESFQIQLTDIVHHLNSTPRRILHDLSPNEVLLGWKMTTDDENSDRNAAMLLDFDQIKYLIDWRKHLHEELFSSI